MTIRGLSGFLGRQSTVGDTALFDPKVFPFLDAFEADWRAIRRELDAVLATRGQLPAMAEISPDNGRIANDAWQIFVFYGFGHRSERNCARCPETARLLARVPRLQNAWFSILGPGAKIPKHKGITKGLLRCHLGLVTPTPPEHCRMKIERETFHWEEGRLVVFDDSRPHSVWNATMQDRVVLLFDFERPMRPLGRLVSRLLLAAFRRHGYLRDARRNEEAWEDRYYAPFENEEASSSTDA